ncbi:hypothetical protein ACLOJK_027473 [Asimina triloba]
MGEAAKDQRQFLDTVRSVVFKESENLEGTGQKIAGYDFNHGVDYPALLKSMISTGFQASNLGYAIQVVNEMLDWRLADDEPAEDCSDEERDLTFRKSVKCKVFLGFTSNLISSGVRETVRFLVEHRMVDVVVTTTGGIEEDIIKCLAPTYRGDFSLPGAYLRSKGLNRIGNLLVPNDNYCKFEDWIIPIFDRMLQEQFEEVIEETDMASLPLASQVIHYNEKRILWTPSTLIARLGKEINDESSYLYWAFKHQTRQRKEKIPKIPPWEDEAKFVNIRSMNGEAVHASPRKTGMMILGGGLPKHHICNANMMRNGADYAVFINTAQEFDGSDSGARPDEAVSWGKIRGSAKTVKVHCDATIAFPLLVAETFAKKMEKSADSRA